MPPASASAAATPEQATGSSDDRSALPWAAIPRYTPGVTDTTEYGKKLKFLAEVWPKEHLSSLAPRVALLCEGSAFKKVARLDATKLKVSDTSGVELIVKTLGGAWGQTVLEEKYEQFEKAIFGTVQRSDETHDSYLARHDIHFEELLAQNITFEELRSYVLLRQSQLSSDDKKRIVVEHSGKLTYDKVKSSIRLLGSRFFGEFQGQRANQRTKVYDANTLEECVPEESERAYQAALVPGPAGGDDVDNELEPEFLEAMLAIEDQDALQVQTFEEELEGYFQETADLQEALVSYLEARSRLLAKKKSRGFWPVGSSGKGGKTGRGFNKGKGRGKSGRDQLLARIARSVCRACGEKGHWKAECPKYGRPGSMSVGKGEAITTVAEVVQETYDPTSSSTSGHQALLTEVPEDAYTLHEAHFAIDQSPKPGALRNLSRLVQFARLSDPTLAYSMEQLSAMTVEQLGEFVIDFGKAMRGRKYMEVIEKEKDWVTWFITHMSTSEKRCHRILFLFIEKYTAQAEEIAEGLVGDPAAAEPPRSTMATRPKSKSAPRPTASTAVASSDHWALVEDNSEPALDNQVTAMATRLTHLEHVMEQVLVALQQITPPQVPPVGGEVWTAQGVNGEQASNGQMVCGEAIPLTKGVIYLNPHVWHATQPWTGDRIVAIGFSLKPRHKLKSPQVRWLKRHGFSLLRKFPRGAAIFPSSTTQESQVAEKINVPSSESPLVQAAEAAACACQEAVRRAEDLHHQSQKLLSLPPESQLDLLEITERADSRLSVRVRELGGKARRFTSEDGDLRTKEGQQQLWAVVQQTQPRHIWVTPDARCWSAWSSLNAAKSSEKHDQHVQQREKDQALYQVCAQLCHWQKQHRRDFHLELPGLFPTSSIKAFPDLKSKTYVASVDMCAFGLQTPAGKPIRKRTLICSTSQDLTKSFVSQQCNQQHRHHTLAGRLLKGLPMSQFAGSFCEGFASHVAGHLVSSNIDAAMAANAEPPLTRKRFKTSVGDPLRIERPVTQKREAAEPAAGSQRSHPIRRLTEPLQAMSELPWDVWEPVFELAQRSSGQASTLVPPQSELAKEVQRALEPRGIDVLQVFSGRNLRNLQLPLGALPATVAPLRVSLGSREASKQLLCLGNEDRTTMGSDRKKLRIGVHEILITVFGRRKAETAEQEPPAGSPGSRVPAVSASPPDLEGWAPPPVPLHGPAFRNLDADQKAQFVRIHNNLGHPAPTTLAKHLKAAGEAQALVDAALDFECDACLESTEPRHQRPGKLPEPLEFNDLIGIDGFFFKGRSGYRAYVIHAIDEASCFHLGRRAVSRETKHATKTLAEFWLSWAGNPRKVYVDPAGEFRSEEILEYFQGINVKTFLSAAAWQRGRVERHGDVVKDMLARLDAQSPLANDARFDQALLLAFQAKNALMRHRGYAPEQIVLGKSLRVPGSLTSDEDLTSHALVEGSDLEAELHRQRLDVRCRARQVFWEADNSQTIRRALLRRSNPARGPYKPGDWVLYWMRKGSPNRLAAGRWHGPARVISQEGQSITWISHGSIILRCAPENLRPASLREWQQLSTADFSDPHKNAGGASSFVDLTGNESSAPVTNAPAPASSSGDLLVPLPTPVSSVSNPATNPIPDDDLTQPEQELTPQVSGNPDPPTDNREVEREVERQPNHAAPSVVLNDNPNASVTSADPLPSDVPVPDSDEGLLTEAMACTLVPEELPEESVLLSTEACDGDLHTFTTVLSGTSACGPPLAEDNLPYVEQPLQCSEQQAYCLEIPMKAKDLRRWARERAPEQLSYLATVGKRARAEVHVKDLSAAELQLFNQAKQKEIQCWIQTSAIKSVLRQRLNPEQILRSRWILTWKNPEPGDTQRKAKARLVVLGYQDPKLVDVSRDAPTLSKEGRALVLQTIASKRFELSSFDIKTAFLRGKADENNPLAMDPPKELREALKLKDNDLCQLLGNAYGRVDAPLLFYKELSKQLLELGFVRHPLEPCVFLLYTGSVLNGILGVHVDDGVCGGDAVFSQKIQSLQTKLPFGSRKHRNFVFTGIHLEQFPDFSIRASQGEYVKNIPQLDIGRARRMQPAAPVTENERSRLRGIIGSLQYAVTHTRPDMAAKLGELQTQVTTATVQTLLLANKVLRETQEQADECIHYLPICPEDITFVSFGDASFASSKNLNSHQGALVCATDSRLDKNQEAPLSPLVWTSKKIPRVVRSTLSAEAYAMSKAVDMLGWIRALWGVVHVPEFRWQSPEESYKKLKKAIIVTDCKSLFDLVTRLAMPACEEHRTTLEVLLIKQRCSENASFRWIPTTLQAADCLTKAMDATLLRTVLAQGRFKLYDTTQALEKDAQRKQAIAWLSQPAAAQT
ncbi:RE1 [Symbiodinium sp. CCMP2592]|nr:RE1 [Symbiodinium sp. CCMP2592]